MPASAKPTACLALSDGTVFYGMGLRATGETVRNSNPRIDCAQVVALVDGDLGLALRDVRRAGAELQHVR